MNRACFSKNTTELASPTQLNLPEQNQHASCIRPLKNNFVRIKKWAVLYFLFFITVSNSNAGNKIVIKNINEKYGLPKNKVNCAFQDSKGFLWFGLANGLYKFDLNNYTNASSEKAQVNGFDVRSITEYTPGMLLIGTYNYGLLIYNTIEEKICSVNINTNIDLSKACIHCLFTDKTGSVWVGTSLGLYKIKRIKKTGHQFELLNQYTSHNIRLVSDDVIKIMEYEGKIWFLTVSDIGCIDPFTQQTKTFATFDANSSFCLMEDKKILIGCFGTGLKILNTETYNIEHYKLNNISDKAQVTAVYKDKDGNTWIGIVNTGIVLLGPRQSPQQTTLISNKISEYSKLNSNSINQVFETKDGALFICTEDGINMIDAKSVFLKSYPCTSFDSNTDIAYGVRAILHTGGSFIWVGTTGGGLKQFDLISHKFNDVPLISNGHVIGEKIQSIIRDHKGNLWIGTEGDGVIKFTPEKNAVYTKGQIINYRLYPNSFPGKTLLNDFIMCILEDSRNNIWIGTWYGLSLIESQELEKTDPSKVIIKNFLNNPSDKNSLSNNTVMSLIEDHEGHILVGTPEGLNKVIKTPTGYRFEHEYKHSDDSLLTKKKILAIYQTRNGDFWFSTQDGGICKLDLHTGIYKCFNSNNGFIDNITCSIDEDIQGNLWLGTNNGIYWFDPASLSHKPYTTEDGLISDELLFASNCKINNNLCFGGNKGITLFTPQELISGTLFKPNLRFTDFRLFNKPVIINGKNSPLTKHISYTQTVTLHYNQNFITIAFAALNYNQQKEILYSCIMEGLETTWNNLREEHKMTYTNLPPGHYHFKVKAYNSGDHPNPTYSTLEIVVKPPYWKTIWAYLLYIALVVFTLYRIYRYAINKEKRENALALERMNAQKTHEMDLMRLRFFTNISHEFRTPLTLISAPLDSLLKDTVEPEKARTYYQLMQKNVQRLTRLINQLLDLRKIEEGYLKMEWAQGDMIEFILKTADTFQNYAEKRNIKLEINPTVTKLNTYFDADKLDKILFNLLSNAFKYTSNDGVVSLMINEKKATQDISFPSETETYIEIRVCDSGQGIPAEALDKIFDLFQQVHNNKPIDSATSGIGLSLVKELVEMHHGTISVESEINKGSCFTVCFPAYKTNPQKRKQSENSKVALHNLPAEDIEISTHKTERSGSTSSKPLVLIVEDNLDLQKFIKDELESLYRLIDATNGEDGLNLAIQKMPDLIISDIMMDKMDGIELCQKIKCDERTSHIPIILLTAKHSEDVKINSYEIGADDYVTKPFSTNILITRIKNLIDQRRKLRTLFNKGTSLDFSAIATNNTDSLFLEKLKQNIEKNIGNPGFDSAVLAANMAMSRMQLYRKVSALTNQTVYNIIRTIRLNKAAQLLVTTDMQISEIAEAIGYSESSNFTRSFTQHFNQTPSQFVRSHRK